MKHASLFAFGLICVASAAHPTITTYTNAADFLAANPNVALIEDFEDSPPLSWGFHLPTYTGPRGLITFTPLDGLWDNNVTIAKPTDITEFAPDLRPLGTYAITTNGNEDIVGTLNIPATSLGFNIFLNDSPGTLAFFNGDTLLATLLFDSPVDPGNNVAFAGIFSSDGVTSFRWTATNGQIVDTGIDNIYAGPVSDVPEPSTWAMMLLGFAAIGATLRRKHRIGSHLSSEGLR
jgi:hypothetical protein